MQPSGDSKGSCWHHGSRGTSCRAGVALPFGRVASTPFLWLSQRLWESSQLAEHLVCSSPGQEARLGLDPGLGAGGGLRSRQLLQPCVREAEGAAGQPCFLSALLPSPGPWQSPKVPTELRALMCLFLFSIICRTTTIAFGTDIILMYSLLFSTRTQMFHTVAKTELLQHPILVLPHYAITTFHTAFPNYHPQSEEKNRNCISSSSIAGHDVSLGFSLL